MISISTTTGDLLGNVILDEDPDLSSLGEKSARVTRTATLDGGAYINHSGFSHGDRTLDVTARISADEAFRLNRIFEKYATVVISMEDGVFLGAIPFLTTENGTAELTIYIKQKESK